MKRRVEHACAGSAAVGRSGWEFVRNGISKRCARIAAPTLFSLWHGSRRLPNSDFSSRAPAQNTTLFVLFIPAAASTPRRSAHREWRNNSVRCLDRIYPDPGVLARPAIIEAQAPAPVVGQFRMRYGGEL